MGGGGPMITGKWVNTRTGEEVTVRDSFMDGEDMIIFLTDGRQLTLGDFQEFVQMSDEEYDEHGNIISNTNGGGIQNNALKKKTPKVVDAATIFAGMDEKPASENIEQEAVNDLSSVLSPEKPAGERTATTDGMNAAAKVIHRASSPKFKVVVEWPDFPKKELQMCKDYFDTTDDDIVKSIIGLHCTGHELEAALTKWLINEMQK